MAKCALYRHFDSAGVLLYVGISISPTNRNKNHSSNAGWFQQVIRIDIEWHDSQEAALWAEDVAIRKENPRHNIQRAGRRGPRSRDPKVETRRQSIIAKAQMLGIKVDKLACLGRLEQEFYSAVDKAGRADTG